MRREPPRLWTDYLPIAWPAAMLGVFFVIPFATMVAVSFFQRDPAAFYTPAFVFSNYARFATPFFFGILGFSLFLAALVAVVAVTVAFPFVW